MAARTDAAAAAAPPGASSRATPPAPPRMRLVRSVGVGGMGAVWLAERTLAEGVTQRVVLKRPLPAGEGPSAATPEAVLRRFRDEAGALARVSHGNVVALLDAGSDAHGPWIAIEHVDGLDAHALASSLRARGERLHPDECAWVAREVARGMAACHGLRDASGEPAPVLHRDLSPQNVLLSRLGEVKVTDFGIAWALDRNTRTTTGVVVGNLRYIAPEQLEGRAVGPATDVYGVGRVLEELLDVTDGDAAALRAVASRCTRRDPDERPASMDALAAALLDACPSLAHGCARLAARVESALAARARVHSALAGLLAAERADVSAPHATGAPLARTSASPRVELTPPLALAPVVPLVAPRAQRLWLLAPAALAVVAGFALARRPAPSRAPLATSPALAPTPTPLPTPSASLTLPATPPPAEAPAPAELRERPRLFARHAPREVAPSVAVDAGAPAAAAATLRVSALPFARVSVDDGAPVGVPHAFEVAAGEHAVRARFEVDGGVVVVSRVVTLRAGETQTLGLTPRP